MKALLKIEAIGCREYQYCKMFEKVVNEVLPGVGTKVTGGSIKRWGVWEIMENRLVEIYGKMDYSKANGAFSRGVYVNYFLESGKRYFVRAPISWKNVDTYTCTVDEEGEIIRE